MPVIKLVHNKNCYWKGKNLYMVKHKKIWRKKYGEGPEPVVHKQDREVFTVDTKGDTRIAGQYPVEFAKKRVPRVLSKTEKQQMKKTKSVAKTLQKESEFNLWEDEADGNKKDWPESHIPAVIPPLAGQSYRPTDSEHSLILQKIVEEEEKKNEIKEKLESLMKPPVILKDKSSDEDDLEPEESNFIKNPPIKPKFFTNAEKNKKLRNKLLKEKEKIDKEKKEKDKDFNKIKEIEQDIDLKRNRNIEKEEKEKHIKNINREMEKNGEKAPKIIMGQFRYEKPPTLGTDKVNTELRKINVKGNPIEDRFDSLVRRRMVDLDPGPNKKQKVIIKERNTGEMAREIHEKRKRQKMLDDPGKVELQ